jgi:Protein of unknown function (DUF3990)
MRKNNSIGHSKWFAAPDPEWAEFIANNRVAQSPPYTHGCLWTYGPMADGKTNKLCHDYFEGHIDGHMLLHGLRPYQELYDQLVFHSEALANAVLLNPRIVQYAVAPERDVHHDAPVYWAKTIARQRNLKTAKPL